MESVLIVEDDRSILMGLRSNLEYEGYEVITATDGERGLALAIEKQPNLIVLDVMLPKLSGFEVCKMLRKRDFNNPIIMLTAKDQEADKVAGLDLGADDYVTKPFSVRELVARVNAALRRGRRETEDETPSYSFDDVVIDFQGRTVSRHGRYQEMSAREFDLLAYLIKNRNRVVDRQEILNDVWGRTYYGTHRTIDNFVNRIRRKIGDDAAVPQRLLTVRGVGYKFVGQEPESDS